MKAIMWDVDDVLNDLMGEWFRTRWIPLHPQCPVDYLGITVNPPHEYWESTSGSIWNPSTPSATTPFGN